MMQVNQLIPRLEPGYEQDAVLRVKGCLYAHFTGPMDHSLSLIHISSQILVHKNKCTRTKRQAHGLRL